MPVPHPQQASAPGTDRSFDTYQPRHAGWVLGMSAFAAMVMIMVGFFHVVEGLAALLDNDIYLAVPRYMFSFNVTVWGWIHLLVGVLLMAAGPGGCGSAPWGSPSPRSA